MTTQPTELYCPPREVVARPVTAKDVSRVIKDGQIMFELCSAPVGIYRRAFAIAHPQINSKDPLTFFVTRDQRVIINPVIIRHTDALVNDVEGCMTFYMKQPIVKGRYYRLELQYQTLDEHGKLTGPMVWAVKGLEARMVQHEIDHFNGIYLYPLSLWDQSLTSPRARATVNLMQPANAIPA